ncbi:hypothetical protein [Phenylobacterium immobile]|uniref:hypothetical protein n=1 Tax=Phenylobacterium immobile TaxID=21 RepID=UPI000AD98DF2|nr:hypothetical protein [Phenylobacterium immobile]
MIRKILTLLAAAAAIFAATVTAVVAAAMALYALTVDNFGPAGAAAIVALAAALVPLALALFFLVKAKEKPPLEEQSLVQRLFEAAKQRPIIATGALAAASVLAVRNPRILTMVLTTLMASKPPRPK